MAKRFLQIESDQRRKIAASGRKNNSEDVEIGVNILFHVSFEICDKVKLYYLLSKIILKNESKVTTLYSKW